MFFALRRVPVFALALALAWLLCAAPAHADTATTPTYDCAQGQCIGYYWSDPAVNFPTPAQACAYGGTQYRPPIPMSWCPADGFCRQAPATNPCAGPGYIVPYVLRWAAPPPPPPPPTAALEESSCPVGNPTLPGSGTKVHHERDYAPAFAHPIHFERHYRSRFSYAPLAPDNGWLHTYSARLAWPGSGNEVFALRPDGQVRRFVRGASGAWAAEQPGLELTAELDATNRLSGWRLTQRPEGRSERYDPSGLLQSIDERNGWRLRLLRDAQGITVVNHFGRSLRLQHDPQGHVSALTTPAGELIRYEHDAQGRHVGVVWPDGHSRRYHYEDPALPNALSGLTDETGQRIGTYRYDAQGRVIETQRANGAERLQFAYGQDSSGAPQTTVTDFSSGAPIGRTWRFVRQGRLLQPAGVSAPCTVCGATAQAIQYDGAGLKRRELQHDGSVVFYRHDARGLEIERAAFPAALASASTRPELALATSVTTTERDPDSGLPTRIAEPARLTTLEHSGAGITAVSTQATSDPSGAAGFNATPSGPLRRTESLYDSQALLTRISKHEDGALTQRWDLAYNDLGDLTGVVDAARGQRATVTQHTADGRALQGTTDQGVPIAVAYGPRGAITQITRGSQTVRFTYNPVGTLVQVRMPDGQVIDHVVDAMQALVDVRLNGASVTAQMLALGDYPDSSTQGRIEAVRQALIRSVQGLLPTAHAQVVVLGGGRVPPPPVLDPRTDMLMSPISAADQAIRALNEAIARACRCDPYQGFGAPKFTAVTFAHVFYGGHMLPMFSDKSYFAPTAKVGQALVDEVIQRATKKSNDRNRDIYNVNMGRVVGMRYDKESTSSDKHTPTQWLTMIVERDNCSSAWRANEVVTLYPDLERP